MPVYEITDSEVVTLGRPLSDTDFNGLVLRIQANGHTPWIGCFKASEKSIYTECWISCPNSDHMLIATAGECFYGTAADPNSFKLLPIQIVEQIIIQEHLKATLIVGEREMLLINSDGLLWHKAEILESKLAIVKFCGHFICGHGQWNREKRQYDSIVKIDYKTGLLLADTNEDTAENTNKNSNAILNSGDFRIFADYHMIYLGDTLLLNSEYEDAFDFNHELMLDSASKNVLRFYTATDRTLKVSVVVHSNRPLEVETLGWDLVSEGSVECPSQTLSIMGTTDELLKAPKLDIYADQVRVRVHSANMTYQDCALDYYLLEVWPEQFSEPKLLFRKEEYINHCVE